MALFRHLLQRNCHGPKTAGNQQGWLSSPWLTSLCRNDSHSSHVIHTLSFSEALNHSWKWCCKETFPSLVQCAVCGFYLCSACDRKGLFRGLFVTLWSQSDWTKQDTKQVWITWDASVTVHAILHPFSSLLASALCCGCDWASSRIGTHSSTATMQATTLWDPLQHLQRGRIDYAWIGRERIQRV